MIKFNCGKCGKKIGAADTAAGKRVKCPKCNAVEVVPPPVDSQADPGLVSLDALSEVAAQRSQADAPATTVLWAPPPAKKPPPYVVRLWNSLSTGFQVKFAAVVLGLVILAGWIVMRDTWERDNLQRLNSLMNDAKQAQNSEQFDQAVQKYSAVLSEASSRPHRSRDLEAIKSDAEGGISQTRQMQKDWRMEQALRPKIESLQNEAESLSKGNRVVDAKGKCQAIVDLLASPEARTTTFLSDSYNKATARLAELKATADMLTRAKELLANAVDREKEGKLEEAVSIYDAVAGTVGIPNATQSDELKKLVAVAAEKRDQLRAKLADARQTEQDHRRAEQEHQRLVEAAAREAHKKELADARESKRVEQVKESYVRLLRRQINTLNLGIEDAQANLRDQAAGFQDTNKLKKQRSDCDDLVKDYKRRITALEKRLSVIQAIEPSELSSLRSRNEPQIPEEFPDMYGAGLHGEYHSVLMRKEEELGKARQHGAFPKSQAASQGEWDCFLVARRMNLKFIDGSFVVATTDDLHNIHVLLLRRVLCNSISIGDEVLPQLPDDKDAAYAHGKDAQVINVGPESGPLDVTIRIQVRHRAARRLYPPAHGGWSFADVSEMLKDAAGGAANARPTTESVAGRRDDDDEMAILVVHADVRLRPGKKIMYTDFSRAGGASNAEGRFAAIAQGPLVSEPHYNSIADVQWAEDQTQHWLMTQPWLTLEPPSRKR